MRMEGYSATVGDDVAGPVVVVVDVIVEGLVLVFVVDDDDAAAAEEDGAVGSVDEVVEDGDAVGGGAAVMFGAAIGAGKALTTLGLGLKPGKALPWTSWPARLMHGSLAQYVAVASGTGRELSPIRGYWRRGREQLVHIGRAARAGLDDDGLLDVGAVDEGLASLDASSRWKTSRTSSTGCPSRSL